LMAQAYRIAHDPFLPLMVLKYLPAAPCLHGPRASTFLDRQPLASTPVFAMSRGHRKQLGLLARRLNVRKNLTLPILASVAAGGVHLRYQGVQVRAIIGAACTSAIRFDHTCGSLSGVNQQKVVFPKWLFTDPEILIPGRTDPWDRHLRQIRDLYCISTMLCRSVKARAIVTLVGNGRSASESVTASAS